MTRFHTHNNMPLPTQTRATSAPSLAIRRVANDTAMELYVTAAPPIGSRLPPADDARRLFTAIREELVRCNARLFSERVFATQAAMPAVEAVRAEVYADLDDGVPPTRLIAPAGLSGGFVGVQVHAVVGDPPPKPFHCWNQPQGMAARMIERGPDRWVFINGLSVAAGGDKAEEARRALYCASCFLRQTGGTFHSVARTWLWLHDINTWYRELNQVRRDSFEREGLLDRTQNVRRLPASTGVGIRNAGDSACALDFIAVPGQENAIHYIEASNDQCSAFAYGSAFSRAAIVPMPAGRTLYISGTAAIDASGASEHLGQIDAQIDDTIAHLRSLLDRQQCGDDDVLTAIVYCKDQHVEQAFRHRPAPLPWPHIVVIAEVCRPELLVEIEVTARCRDAQ